MTREIIGKDIPDNKKGNYVANIKIKIYSAFTELNKNKICAIMNFEDCQSCGCCEINKITEHTDHIGWVFYHNQDDDDLWNKGELYLAYKGLTTTVTNIDVAKIIIDTLNKNGLITEWDGDDNKRILISGYIKK